MRERLVIQHQDGSEVAVLEQRGAVITILSAETDGVRSDLERWVKEGVVTHVGAEGDRDPTLRWTLPGNPELLDRIAERLRVYSFVVTKEILEDG